jgi:serine/threonine-protein kinase
MQLETFGKYRLVAKIGQGAMGEVYRAHDTALGRDVAVKTILADMGRDDTLRKRFQREAQSAARLNHPNIIKVYDFGEQHGRLYMAMELLEGLDLKQAIAERRLGTLDAKLALMQQIAEGLAFAHRNDVVHRDLKPANVHVQPDGSVKIMDFGLARLSGSDMTRSGMIMGTPHYMSPEQVRGERVDARSDVFSVGCIFYEVLTERKPFDADSMHAVLFKVLQDEPPPVRAWVPDLPLVAEQVLARALAKQPDERFADAGGLQAALEQARTALEEGRGAEPLDDLPLPMASAMSAPTATGSAPESARAAASLAGPATIARARQVSGSTKLLLMLGSALAAVTLGVMLAAFMMRGRGTQPEAGPTGPVDGLARAVAGTQTELARKKLEAGDYEGARRQAEQALGLDPANAEAKALLERAKRILTERQRALDEARRTADGDDPVRAREALRKLMLTDPNHPQVAALAARQEGAFQQHADEARRAMLEARGAAEQAGFAAVDAFRDGQRLAREGEAAAQARKWATAAARYWAARERFLGARGVGPGEQRS